MTRDKARGCYLISTRQIASCPSPSRYRFRCARLDYALEIESRLRSIDRAPIFPILVRK